MPSTRVAAKHPRCFDLRHVEVQPVVAEAAHPETPLQGHRVAGGAGDGGPAWWLWIKDVVFLYGCNVGKR